MTRGEGRNTDEPVCREHNAPEQLLHHHRPRDLNSLTCGSRAPLAASGVAVANCQRRPCFGTFPHLSYCSGTRTRNLLLKVAMEHLSTRHNTRVCATCVPTRASSQLSELLSVPRLFGCVADLLATARSSRGETGTCC